MPWFGIAIRRSKLTYSGHCSLACPASFVYKKNHFEIGNTEAATGCHGRVSLKNPVNDAGTPLGVQDQFVAGLGAGVSAAMVACPTELIKCRLQAQGGTAPDAPSPSVRYKGSDEV